MNLRNLLFFLPLLIFASCNSNPEEMEAATAEPMTKPMEFTSHRVVDNAKWWWALTIGDVTNDGLQDVVFINNNANGGYLGFRVGSKDGGLWKETIVAEAPPTGGTFAAGDLETGDMDGDGDLDLISGYRVPGADAEVPTFVVWFENPGSLLEDWPRHPVGNSVFATDRVEAADLNGDGRADVVVAEERYPGLEPDASLWAFLQSDTGFVRQKIVTQFSMNNLDIVDMDGDGDQDILTAEHKGEALTLQLWLNDGSARFTKQEIDRGKESHLGAQAYDMDGDGDLDIISIGWDQHKYVHLWRNDAIR